MREATITRALKLAWGEPPRPLQAIEQGAGRDRMAELVPVSVVLLVSGPVVTASVVVGITSSLVASVEDVAPETVPVLLESPVALSTAG